MMGWISKTLAGAKRRWKLAAALGVLLLVAATVFVTFLSRDDDDHGFRLRGNVPAPGPDFPLALYQTVGTRMLPGHHVAIVDNGAVFDTIVDEINQARSSVHVVMYIWEKGSASDRVNAALVARAKAGVRCLILVDDFGSPDFDEDVAPKLTSAGCHVRPFRPIPGRDELARNHRKVVIVDGKVAITGGFGIRDNWLGDGVSGEAWRDASVRFTGPAVIDAQQAFAENWQESGGTLLPADAFPAPDTSGPSSAAFVASTASPIVTRAERLAQLMIAAARKRIWIANAYFVPSDAMSEALGRKASAGVDVRVLAPGVKSDSKTSFGAQQVEYRDLLARGVRVWEYAPSMLHSKTILIDDELTLVSSINLEPLSLTKLEDAGLVTLDRALATKLSDSFLADCKHARELERK